MNYPHSDSSGTDDDIPPSHQNRFANVGRASANGRSSFAGAASLGTPPFPQIHTDMEAQIHQIEQEAYSSVLRAFKAQSDAITWEKESLITELRKELRVSDEEHRVLLSRVNADDIIWRIRDWRAGELQNSTYDNGPARDSLPSPTVSASRKKQKASNSVPPLSMGAPSPALHPSMQPFSSSMKRGPGSGVRGKKPKAFSTTSFNGRAHVAGQGSAFGAIEAAEVAHHDPLVGKKVWTRWPEDNSFYEAVITDYNPVKGLHALVYDINTADETWEWVNLKEISSEDLRWEGEDPGIAYRGGRSGSGRGFKNSISRGGGSFAGGRGRGIIRNQSKRSFPPSQNNIAKKTLGDIEILDTDTLVKEVEKVFGASHLDPMEIEKAKNVLKEHEQALIDAIAKLEDVSDGESDKRELHFSNDQEKGTAETT